MTTVRAISDPLEHLLSYFRLASLKTFLNGEFQLSSIVQGSTALLYVRDVTGSSPENYTYSYDLGFIFFSKLFFFQSFSSRYFRFVTYFSFFKLFTKSSIRKI